MLGHKSWEEFAVTALKLTTVSYLIASQSQGGLHFSVR